MSAFFVGRDGTFMAFSQVTTSLRRLVLPSAAEVGLIAGTHSEVSHWVQADAPERINELLRSFPASVRGEMRGLLKRVVSEPGADTAESFVRRIRLLAATYTVLFLRLLCGRGGAGRLRQALRHARAAQQRRDAHRLFLLVFYGYLAAISAPACSERRGSRSTR